jgi:predicted DNA-binding transcriptional regulator AlpA
MLPTTLDIIRSCLKSDPTVSPAERKRLMALLVNAPAEPSAEISAPAEARLIRRAEVARRLGCSLRLVDRLLQDGTLPKRRLPNRQRAAGVLESDLLRLLAAEPEGRATMQGKEAKAT